jgi:hypothetical protein
MSHANKRRPSAVQPSPRVVSKHAEADDVGRPGELREIRVRNWHRSVQALQPVIISEGLPAVRSARPQKKPTTRAI